MEHLMPTRRSRLVRSISSLTLLLALAGTGCPGSDAPDPPDVEAQTGALGVHVKKPVKDVNKLEYKITRSGQFYRDGTFIIGNFENSFSAVIGGVEANTGYMLELAAEVPNSASHQKTQCLGSAPFDVAAGETTVVSLILHCDGIEEKPPSERCPIVSMVRILPSEAPVGKCVILKVLANVVGTLRTPLKYGWRSSWGKLSHDEGPNVAKFECTEIGISSITVDLETTDSECASDSVTVHVTCSSGDTRGRRHADTGAAGSAAPKH
jgi:hypothetical protein